MAFDAELDRLLFPVISQSSVGRISLHPSSRFEYAADSIASFDIACNTGANIVQNNKELIAKAYENGAAIRIMVNDPGSSYFNGTTTFSQVFCRDSTGQPAFTEAVLKTLNAIYHEHPNARGSLEIKIANFAITGQLVIINKDYVSNLSRSFSEAWNNAKKMSSTMIDVSDIAAIDSLVQEWVRIKASQPQQELVP